jgi:hypothetical protein
MPSRWDLVRGRIEPRLIALSEIVIAQRETSIVGTLLMIDGSAERTEAGLLRFGVSGERICDSAVVLIAPSVGIVGIARCSASASGRVIGPPGRDRESGFRRNSANTLARRERGPSKNFRWSGFRRLRPRSADTNTKRSREALPCMETAGNERVQRARTSP